MPSNVGTRLLVALRPREPVTEAVTRGLPGIAWSYAAPGPTPDWSSIEAMLVGSVQRELGDYDPALTPRLQFVQCIYTGVDGFPFERFPDRVRIAGNGGAFAPFVAEHAVALALAAARGIVPAQAQVRAGRLRPVAEQRLLWGRTAVILGYGEIGRAIAARLAGFEMRIIGVNRAGRMSPGLDVAYPADRLREAVTLGDFVFDVRPLTNVTAHTIGAEELAAMPAHGVYVNVGRAGTVDPEALYRHLTGHPSFRAALDPWWDEDYTNGTFVAPFPFSDLPNFVGTPHSAGLGPSTEKHALDRALANLARYFRGEGPLYVVDRREYAASARASSAPSTGPVAPVSRSTEHPSGAR